MKRYRTDLIRPPQPGDDKFFGDVNTRGIIDAVLFADPKSGGYTKQFAPTLKAPQLFETCHNIWEFVKQQIPYVLDKTGYQWIKSPGRLWQEKSGDCKSFSVFIASCLKNLGIEYGYRFASYDSNDPTPTHVYVYVPLKGGGELIVDSVWSGPFNSQKLFSYKQDFLMSKTFYLGAVRKHIPGVLKIETPIADLTDGELDLLLLRQKLEIQQLNSGMGSVNYNDEVMKTIDHCIRNVGCPDVIQAIGEALEEGYDMEHALSGIGKKSKKPAAPGEKKKKTGAGKLLQKVAKGIKTGVKAITKVVNAPVILLAKGALELYLPKAAPFFLYLFAPNPDTLPDMMKRKRKKAEKLKNFIVKGIGMKEKHFMQVIENNITKRYGMPPTQYLAEKLKTRVSGIGNPKHQWRHHCDTVIAGIGKKGGGTTTTKRKVVKKKPNLRPAAKKNFNTTMNSSITDSSDGDQQVQQGGGGGLQNVMEKVSSGNWIGGAIAAIGWLLGKIIGLFGKKGEKLEAPTPADFPDVERDASNSFEYQDLKADYSNLNSQQKDTTKEVITDAITKGLNNEQTQEWIKTKLPFLNNDQQQEMKEEVHSGPEAIDEVEAKRLANKMDTGNNNNGLAMAAVAVVAVFALAK